MKPTQIYIDREVIKQLKHNAIDLDITMSELIRRLINLYLENPDDKSFKRIQSKGG